MQSTIAGVRASSWGSTKFESALKGITVTGKSVRTKQYLGYVYAALEKKLTHS